MNFVRKPFAVSCVVGAGMTVLALSGCGQANQSTGEPTASSVNALLGVPGDAGIPDSGIFACPACIESSCSDSISALATELKTLGTEAHSAFDCTVESRCLAQFGTVGDAGAAAGRAAVEACVAACDADAGLPSPDAAQSEVTSLVDAVNQCVETSCAASCPGVARALEDQ
jgi:hypothetical protein